MRSLEDDGRLPRNFHSTGLVKHFKGLSSDVWRMPLFYPVSATSSMGRYFRFLVRCRTNEPRPDSTA